jgi:opacity protein-like surface antigen
MRRRRNFMAAGLGLFFMIAAVAHPSGLSFRFFGGAGFLPTSGDFKELFDSTSQRWKDVGIGGTFDLDYAPWAYEGGLQAVFQLAPSFGLRLGVGYFSKVWNQSPHLTYNGGGPATLDIQNTYDLKSIPLTLDAVVTIPLGIVRFNIFGGGGYYLTRVNFATDSQYSEPTRSGQPNWKWQFRSDFASAWKGDLGFQFGAGLDIALSNRMSLIIEGLYRSVGSSGFQGPLTVVNRQTWTGGSSSGDLEKDNATLWYETSNISGRIYHYMEAWDTKPTASDSAREFKISLEGFSLRLGIQIGI